MQKLLHLAGLGDKLLSILAAKILALVPTNTRLGYLERQIFIDQLPLNIRAHMVTHEEEKDIWVLGKIADHYVASSGAAAPLPTFAVAQPAQQPPSFPQRPQTPTFPDDSAVSTSCCHAVGKQSTYCFYHHRFGASVKQCEGPPCTWKKSRQGNANTGRR